MPDQPTVLYLHTVFASRGHDGDREIAAIEDATGIDVIPARTPQASRDHIESAEIVIATGGGVPDHLLDHAEQLEWIQSVSSGVDGFEMDRLRNEGIVLTNAAGINSEAIANQVFGYLTCFERKIHQGWRQQADSVWERYEGGELLDKTLGLIGVGSVGERLAEIGSAFGMEVYGVKRSPEQVHEAVDRVGGPEELDAMLAAADYVVVACPLTEDTRGMIDEGAIQTMKQSAYLVNVARGPIVDYDALTTAVQQHEIAGAALDVFPEEPYSLDSPLWGLSNVIMTPHMAGSNPRKPERIGRIFDENFQAYRRGALDEMPTRVE